MRFLKIVGFGILGFVIGLGLWKLENTVVVDPWTRLAAPPQRVSELIPYPEPPVYIRTTDGQTYYYSDFHNQGWLPQSIPERPGNPFESTSPCDLSSNEFSVSSAPRDIADCFQETTGYADGNIRYAFVLDSQGNVWEWKHTSSPEDLTGLFCFPLGGLLVGLAIAFIATASK